MKLFNAPLGQIQSYNDANEALEKGKGPIQITGCVESQKVQIMSQAGSSSYRLIVTYSEQRARELCEDFQLFTPGAMCYPARDVLFYNADIRGNSIGRERMSVLRRRMEENGGVIITTIDGLMNTLPPFDVFTNHIITLSEGDVCQLGELAKKLVFLGYERMGKVEEPGEFALHGGILDIYDYTQENPWRIEFWDDEIDTIREFDPESQRSIERIESVSIFPATELLLDEDTLESGRKRIIKDYEKNKAQFLKAAQLPAAAQLQETYTKVKDALDDHCFQGILEGFLPYFYPDSQTLVDLLPKDTMIFLEEPVRLSERAKAVDAEFKDSMEMRLQKGYLLPEQMKVIRSDKQIFAEVSTKQCVAMTGLDQKLSMIHINQVYSIEVQNTISYQGNFQGLVSDLRRMKTEKFSVVLLCASKTRGSRMAEELRDYGISAFFSDDSDREVAPGELCVFYGNLHKGFAYPQIKFVVLTEGDIFGKEQKKKRKKSEYSGQKIQSFSQLNVGDYVVHESHGIGVYQGIENIVTDHVGKDYIKIEYGDGGHLYVPVTNLDVIQKYAAADAKPPKLNKLNSGEWKKTKSKVKTAVREVAEELVELYALRQNGKGYVYGPDTVWQKEFEELFPYEETQDQLDAIDSTKKDMESSKIMDRLICGDVGFGKTEVAIRAAFKAVQESKQVVYLVPTTILAQQHYNTFCQRMKDYPVHIELLSRFRSQAQQKRTLEGLRKGEVDIVIGTHRVLSKDVSYKNLGLLIIDEEQRFGVTHKEKIKQMKNSLDVLTLTATPIPRTLHMSMIGVRDMSVLEEAPTDRHPIQTYVMEYSDEMVREAIQRELARNGQVYYVYNRVQDIDEVASRVARLVPDANVAFAHGQMHEHQLERIMLDFLNGEIDVLVSTTIIETGLDIPNVNTIIIHDSDRYGLSTLYQLRGRVGRSNRQAYAFIMYKKNKMLNEEAQKRLEAIRQFTELGSGIKIAMRDLEIRGAGAVLGEAQSGHMSAVGYDLYCKMLAEAVRHIRGDGESEEENLETSLDIKIDAYIPVSYIRNESVKLEIYKKISTIENKEDWENMQDELIDRFGELPKQVENLLRVAYLRAKAKACYITDIKGTPMELKFIFSPTGKVKGENMADFLNAMHGSVRYLQGEAPALVWTQKNLRETGKVPLTDIIDNILIEINQLLIL